MRIVKPRPRDHLHRVGAPRITDATVHGWLRKTSGNHLAAPSLEAVGPLTERLNVFLDLGPMPKLTNVLGKSRKTAQSLVRQLKEARNNLNGLDISPQSADINSDRLTRTIEEVQGLIDDFPVGPMGGQTWHHWPVVIAELARQAWLTSNDDVPAYANEGEPVCEFTKLAMDGLDRSFRTRKELKITDGIADLVTECDATASDFKQGTGALVSALRGRRGFGSQKQRKTKGTT